MNAARRLFVVIPALDEERSIGHVISAIPAGLGARVVVVDNGSRDRTAEVARALGAIVLREQRRGYGRACLTGAEYALAQGAQIIAFLDGDFSDHPEELDRLLEPLVRGEADLTVGGRLHSGMQRGAMAWHAALGNRVVARLVDGLYGLSLNDLGPFRVIHAELFRRLHMREMTYGWPVEMLAKVARAGGRIVEVPVSYRRRIGASKVSGTLRGTLGATYFLLTRTVAYLHWRAET